MPGIKKNCKVIEAPAKKVQSRINTANPIEVYRWMRRIDRILASMKRIAK